MAASQTYSFTGDAAHFATAKAALNVAGVQTRRIRLNPSLSRLSALVRQGAGKPPAVAAQMLADAEKYLAEIRIAEAVARLMIDHAYVDSHATPPTRGATPASPTFP